MYYDLISDYYNCKINLAFYKKVKKTKFYIGFYSLKEVNDQISYYKCYLKYLKKDLLKKGVYIC